MTFHVSRLNSEWEIRFFFCYYIDLLHCLCNCFRFHIIMTIFQWGRKNTHFITAFNYNEAECRELNSCRLIEIVLCLGWYQISHIDCCCCCCCLPVLWFEKPLFENSFCIWGDTYGNCYLESKESNNEWLVEHRVNVKRSLTTILIVCLKRI